MRTETLLPPLRGVDDLRAIESTPLEARDLPRTTWDLVQYAADTYTDALANVWLPDPARPELRVTYTFAEFRRTAARYATVFAGLGLDRSEAVALLTPNVSRLLPTFIGAQATGIAAPMNPGFDIDRIATLVSTTQARIMVAAGPEFGADRWTALTANARRMGVSAVLALRPDGATGVYGSTDPAPGLGVVRGVNTLYLDDAASSVSNDGLPGPAPRPDDIASYFHTGGTTGVPKVAAHTHANEAFVAWNIAAAGGFGPGEVILAGLPLFHVNGLLVTGLAPLLAGATSVWPGPLGWREPALLRNIWRLVEEFGITAMSAVPTVYAQLALREVDADISTLRTPIVGAAPLPNSVTTGFAEHTGIHLQEGYGLTEAGCASSFTPHSAGRPGSVGQRLPYQRVAAAEFDESGHPVLLAPGAAGEIVIAGPAVFAGYVKRTPDGTRFDTSDVVDGWLRTGDLGYIDADERVWITGRRKDLIIRGGHNIDPGVIEEALLAHPHVRSAAAIGRPDRHSGEVPIAYVTVDADYAGDDLVAWAAAHIDERAARPQTVAILDELPMTAVGKPFKPPLRALTIAALLTAGLADAGIADAVADARATDSGLVVDVHGPDRAVDVARALLIHLSIEAEVVHVR